MLTETKEKKNEKKKNHRNELLMPIMVGNFITTIGNRAFLSEQVTKTCRHSRMRH